MSKIKMIIQSSILFLCLFLYFLSSSVLFASLERNTIEFTNKELDAALLLIKVEKSSFELNGRALYFSPAPSLKFFGVDEVEEKIDLSFLGNIVDLRFDHLSAMTPKISFLSSNELEIKIPIKDNPFALKSLLGSIRFKNVFLTATLGWRNGSTFFSNDQGLYLKRVQIIGNISGKGLLSSNLILNKLKNFAEKKLSNALSQFLDKDSIRGSIENGLLRFAEFQVGEEAKQLSSDGVHFFSNEISSGIQYSVE